MKPSLILTLLAAAAGLAACQPSGPTRSPAEISAHAATLKPADPRLAGLYAQACKACHAMVGTLAPQTGDREAWAPRVAKGMPVLLHDVVAGFKGMPAGGQCFACTADDDKALIRFMADQPVS